MAYALTKDLVTGNAMIDRQHQQLFDAINELLDACSKGRGRAEISKTLEFLNSYVEKHFSDEQNLQLKYHYPEYEKHKGFHDGFKKTIHGLRDELAKEGTNVALVAKVNTSIAGWLINHIKREDVKMAKFIRERQ